jgi:hypothetical protein
MTGAWTVERQDHPVILPKAYFHPILWTAVFDGVGKFCCISARKG